MRTVVIYLFVLLFTWGGNTEGTDCSELFKLPELLKHYQAEKESGKTNNILDFLIVHYFQLSDDCSDEEHFKLPFQDDYEAHQSVFAGFSWRL